MTNNGELANQLMHPRYQIEKTYMVATKKDIPRSKFSVLSKGLNLDSRTIAYGKIHRLGKKGGLIHWEVILCEGKNHEVKRIFKTLGATVIHLHRKCFAGITADNISPGKYRELNKNEINELYRSTEL